MLYERKNVQIQLKYITGLGMKPRTPATHLELCHRATKSDIHGPNSSNYNVQHYFCIRNNLIYCSSIK